MEIRVALFEETTGGRFGGGKRGYLKRNLEPTHEYRSLSCISNSCNVIL